MIFLTKVQGDMTLEGVIKDLETVHIFYAFRSAKNSFTITYNNSIVLEITCTICSGHLYHVSSQNSYTTLAFVG